MTHPSIALAPPDKPVPAPRGTTVTPCRDAHRMISLTCSVLTGRASAIGVPGGYEVGPVTGVRRHDVRVGSQHIAGKVVDKLVNCPHAAIVLMRESYLCWAVSPARRG